MRIERLNFIDFPGLGNIQLDFPVGPVLLILDSDSQRLIHELVLELLYNSKQELGSKVQSSEGSIEAWIVCENIRYYIRRDFFKQEGEQDCSSSLVIKDQDGRIVSLPDSMVLGEYLFQVKLQAFRQGGVIEWPEGNERNDFLQRVQNLRQGGDEELSLDNVRAALAGAQKKVKDQKEKISLAKAEYDTLRREWESAHRLLDEERSLQIEVKNLREKQKIVQEKIDWYTKIQERLALLDQNPDYRELRKLHGELTDSKERFHALDLSLKSLTSDSQVDFSLIDNLREECREWAFLQEEVEQIAQEAKRQTWEIEEIQESLRVSGFHGLPQDEYERLLRTQEEREKAQNELDAFSTQKNDLILLQERYSNETSRLQELAVMAGVTEDDQIKIAQKELHLKQLQSSRILRRIDGLLKTGLGGKGISDKLSSQLVHYYKSFQTSNNKEFMNKLQAFRDQEMLVTKVRLELDRLQERLGLMEKLQKVVHSRNEILKTSLAKTNVEDLSAWLKGWEDYQSQTRGLTQKTVDLQERQEKLLLAEHKLAICAEQLRQRLEENWGETTRDRDEVLAVVLKVASKLRAKEEAQNETRALSQQFQDSLGARDLDYLAKTLEPMAELERELRFSSEEREQKLVDLHNEIEETNRLLVTVEQKLKHSQQVPSLTTLEKKIEIVKQKCRAHENLLNALNEAQVLLEASWQEWQEKYSKPLNDEMTWILDHFPTAVKNDLSEVKRDYFSYRLAVAQLALNGTEAPLLFSVKEMEEDRLWHEILDFLQKLSISRQVIICTTDSISLDQLSKNGWQRCATIVSP